MKRSYYSKSVEVFLKESSNKIIGELAINHKFDLDKKQRNSWVKEIEILKEQLAFCPEAHKLIPSPHRRSNGRTDTAFTKAH